MADVRHLPSGCRRGAGRLRILAGVLLALAVLAGCRLEPQPPPASRQEGPAGLADPPVLPAAESCGADESWTLEPGFSSRGAVGTAADPCDYSFAVEAGRFLALEIEQMGADLIVEVWEKGGDQVLQVDSPSGSAGIEPVLLAPARRTEYLLRARWSGKATAEAAHFAARLAASRPATAADRAAAEAWRQLSAAEIGQARGLEAAASAANYQQAVELFGEAGEPGLAGRTALTLALFLAADPRTRTAAAAAFERAVAANEAGDLGQLARALHGLGMVSTELGRYEQARSAFERALRIRRRQGMRSEEGTSLSDLAGVLRQQRQIHLAIERYSEAIEVWQELENPTYEATSRTNLGQLYMQVGDRRQAAFHFRRSLRLLDGAEESGQKAWILVNLGEALKFLEGPEEALPRFREALRINIANQDAVGEALTRNSIGLAQKAAQRPQEALEALRSALAIYRAKGLSRESCTVAGNLAEALEDLGQAERAREEFLQALSCAREVALGATQVDALYGLARVDRTLGDRRSALAHLEQALSLLEEQRLSPAHSDQRSSFLDARLEVYELMVDLLVEDAEESGGSRSRARAFEVSERSRARGLLDSLRRGPGPANGARIQQLIEISEQVNALHRQRIEAKSAAPDLETTMFDEALAPALGRYQQLEAELWSLETEPAAIPTLETVRQSLLAPGTLLLSYYLTERRSFVWSVSRAGVRLRELPGRAAIEAMAGDLLARLERQADPVQESARELALRAASRQLLAPVAEELEDAERVMVIPSGALKGLPFGALPDPNRPGAPLIAGHQISYLPSVAALAELRRAPASRTNDGIAILADPVVGAADERWQGRTPAAGGGSRARLEFSAGEAERILAAAGDRPRLAAAGFEASRDLLMSGRLADYRWLHIAGHGFRDDSWPELSSLLLSAYSPDGTPRDGFLRSYEIRRLRISAELVTLSACETAAPRAPGAEGMLGLSRGFFDAGAKSVLMSLWPVHDAATSELMSRFYRHLLAEGEPPARALQLAQQSMAADERWSEPFFWAAFVLYGDWRGAGEEAATLPLFTTTR